jgi:hypothetical protein
MEKRSRILVNLVGVLTLIGAIGFMFTPGLMEPDFSILPTRPDGWGTLRADIGGSFLAIAIFTFLGAQPGKSHWLWVPLIFVSAFLFGRVVHIVFDGISLPAIRSLIVEVVLLVVVEWSRRVLSKADREAGAKQ